jgi:NAD/NADP transhydrogenase beta subunit
MTGSEQAAAEDAPTTPIAGMPVPQDWKAKTSAERCRCYGFGQSIPNRDTSTLCFSSYGNSAVRKAR